MVPAGRCTQQEPTLAGLALRSGRAEGEWGWSVEQGEGKGRHCPRPHSPAGPSLPPRSPEATWKGERMSPRLQGLG